MSLTVGNMYRFGNYSHSHNQEGEATIPFQVLDDDGVTWLDRDPTAVVLIIIKPDQTRLRFRWPTAQSGDTGVLEHESTGRFFVDSLLDMAGVWHQVLTGTGDVAASSQSSVYVAPRAA